MEERKRRRKKKSEGREGGGRKGKEGDGKKRNEEERKATGNVKERKAGLFECREVGQYRAMRWLGTGLAALGMVACGVQSSRVPDPTVEMARGLGVELAELQRGHATYVNHCNQCHDRIPPGKIDPEYWRGIVPHMAVNAQIDEKEEQELLLYLMAAHGTVHGANLQH